MLRVWQATGVIAVAIALAGTVHARQAPALDVKLGLWEVTTTMKLGGDFQMDTSKMPADQRAKMEAAMEALKQPRTATSKSCLKKTDLARLFADDAERCTQTLVKDTPTVLDAKVVCKGDEVQDASLHLEATSPTAIRGTMKGSQTSDGRSTTFEATIAGKWVSAACGNVD